MASRSTPFTDALPTYEGAFLRAAPAAWDTIRRCAAAMDGAVSDDLAENLRFALPVQAATDIWRGTPQATYAGVLGISPLKIVYLLMGLGADDYVIEEVPLFDTQGTGATVTGNILAIGMYYPRELMTFHTYAHPQQAAAVASDLRSTWDLVWSMRSTTAD